VSTPAAAGSSSKDALFAHVAAQYAGFFGTWLINVGRRALLLETLRDHGPLTDEALAAQLGFEPRYVRTWCRGAYAFELLEHDPERGYSLAPHVDEILLDPADPSFMGGRAEFFPMLTADFELYPARLRDGGLYPFSARPPELVTTMQAAARADAPNAIRNVLPSAPGLEERLRAGGRILDAGCGAGYGLAAFSEAFPEAELVGIETDAASLEAARSLASGRARVVDVQLLEAGFRDEFDLVWANISLSHTWGSTPDVFAALAAAARPGGYVLCSDVPYAERLEELRSTAGRLFTGVTVYVSLLGFELLTPAELLDGMRAAGLEDVRIVEQPARTRMMALGRKP
jgi:SAM-dependent methyltransferase